MAFKSLTDFVKSIPTDLESIISKARYLYLELGKRSFYDPEYKYFIFGEEEQYGNYTNKSYQNPNMIICTTLAKQYSEVLTIAGIRNHIIYDNGHYYVEFYDEDGRIHNADITNDLKNIQFSCMTSYFAKETISMQDLRKIDISLGYISEDRGYCDEYWYIVRDILKNSKLTQKQKLEIAIDNLKRFGDITVPGESEIFYIYQKFIRYCLPDSQNILFYSCKQDRYKKEKCNIQLDIEGKRITYTLNPETRMFEEQTKRAKNVEDNER